MPPFAWAVDWDIICCHDTSWKDDAEWTLTCPVREEEVVVRGTAPFGDRHHCLQKKRFYLRISSKPLHHTAQRKSGYGQPRFLTDFSHGRAHHRFKAFHMTAWKCKLVPAIRKFRQTMLHEDALRVRILNHDHVAEYGVPYFQTLPYNACLSCPNDSISAFLSISCVFAVYVSTLSIAITICFPDRIYSSKIFSMASSEI